MKPIYEIYIGNIGTVSVTGYTEAKRVYATYVAQSQTGYGRAAGESVIWCRDGEIYKEYIGTVDQEREEE